MAKMDLESRFCVEMKKNGWYGKYPVLLGVSGGSDSIAMLQLFARLYGGAKIVVAHLDHGMRNTAQRDWEFVESLCNELGAKFVIGHKKLYDEVGHGESVEVVGRRLRYELYERVSKENNCVLTALGHTKTDLAESVLLNIARGSGLWGLAGIPPQRGVYIRPLLQFEREELRDYLRKLGCGWVEDETNSEDIFTRNRVRHHVFPMLKSYVNPQVATHMAELAQEAWEWRKEQERFCAETFKSTAVPFNEWPSLSLSKLRKLSDFQRVALFRFIGRRLHLGSISRNQIQELSKRTVASGRWLFQWGSEVDVFAENGALHFSVATEKRPKPIKLYPNQEIRWGGWKIYTAPLDSPTVKDDFGFICSGDINKSVMLYNNASSSLKIDLIFPIVEQEGIFLAKRLNGKWDFGKDSVKYTSSFRVVLMPLVGCWREIKWS